MSVIVIGQFANSITDCVVLPNHTFPVELHLRSPITMLSTSISSATASTYSATSPCSRRFGTTATRDSRYSSTASTLSG